MKYSELDETTISDALGIQGIRRHKCLLSRGQAPSLKNPNIGYRDHVERIETRRVQSYIAPTSPINAIDPAYRPATVGPFIITGRLVHHHLSGDDQYLDYSVLYSYGLLLAKEYDLHITRRDRRITRRAAYRPDR